MLRSGVVNTIRELAVQGKPIRALAKEVGLARNTVRKHLRRGAEARPRPPRPSKLDPYKQQLRHWVCADHLYNCETLRRRRQALASCGGLPRTVLTDRMKAVLLEMESGAPHWHPRFQELVSALGITPRVCKPYTPQTKGKVERSVGLVKHDFWPGVRFSDLDDLNQQAHVWCDQLNRRVHRTTHQRPVDLLAAEGLRPLPADWAWERFVAEERRV